MQLVAKVPFYITLYKDIDLKNFTEEKFYSLPLTTADDLANNSYNFIPSNKITKLIVGFHTSGTSKNIKYIFYTKNDLKRLGCILRKLYKPFVTPRDRVLGMAKAGHISSICAFMSAYAAGGVWNMFSVSESDEYISAIIKYRPTILQLFPAVLSYIVTNLQSKKIDPKGLGIEKILLGGQRVTKKRKDYFEDIFKAKVYNFYGSTEEIIAGDNMCQFTHLIDSYPDYYIIELLDQSGKKVEQGEQGECVITRLGVEGTQLIRYRTGDILKWIPGPCKCGLKTPRLEYICRNDEMVVIGTTNFSWTSENDEKLTEKLKAEKVEDYRIEITEDRETNRDCLVFKLRTKRKMNTDIFLEIFKSEFKDLYKEIIKGLIELKLRCEDSEFNDIIESKSLMKIIDKRGGVR